MSEEGQRGDGVGSGGGTMRALGQPRVCDELLRARTHLVQQHEEQEAQRAT